MVEECEGEIYLYSFNGNNTFQYEDSDEGSYEGSWKEVWSASEKITLNFISNTTVSGQWTELDENEESDSNSSWIKSWSTSADIEGHKISNNTGDEFDFSENLSLSTFVNGNGEKANFPNDMKLSCYSVTHEKYEFDSQSDGEIAKGTDTANRIDFELTSYSNNETILFESMDYTSSGNGTMENGDQFTFTGNTLVTWVSGNYGWNRFWTEDYNFSGSGDTPTFDNDDDDTLPLTGSIHVGTTVKSTLLSEGNLDLSIDFKL